MIRPAKRIPLHILLFCCFMFLLSIKCIANDDYPTSIYSDRYGGYIDLKNSAMDSLVDPWVFYNRECTSFAAWCLNTRNGIDFSNSYGGVHWGNASNWGYAAESIGISVDMNPVAGDVAWNSSGIYGHVAWVESVSGDTVTIEEYNNPGGSGRYNRRENVSKSAFDGFIHLGGTQVRGQATVDRGQDGIYLVGENVTMSVNTSLSTYILYIVRTPPGGQTYTYWEGQIYSSQRVMQFSQPGYYACTFYANGVKQDFNASDWVGWVVLDSSTKYTFDVNAYLDGSFVDTAVGVGTFDVYMDGKKVADDVGDYFGDWPVGTSYEISDIRLADGISYDGISGGSRTGSVRKSPTEVKLAFHTIPQSPGVSPTTGKYNGHTYYYYATESSWYEAKKLCENLGGHLVTINDSGENNFVYELVGHSPVWLGLTDRDSKGTWKWVTGEPLTYSNWYPGEPNNTTENDEGDESFVQYTASVSSYAQWNDNSGYKKYGFVCEIEPKYTVTFAPNGGTGSMAAQSVTGGSSIKLPTSTFTAPAGKQFKSWRIGSLDYAPGATLIVNANTTVTAVWEDIPKSTYTVTFASNGGTGSMAAQSVIDGGSITLPESAFNAPAGKRFKTWRIGGADYAPGATYTVTGNTTVTAIWENIPAPITSAAIVVDSVTAQKGGTVSVPIRIKDNPGVASMRLDVSYDRAVMALTDVSDGGLLGTSNHNPNKSVYPYTLSWENDTATTDFKGNGVLVTLTFSIAKNAAEGNYAVTVSFDADNADILDHLMHPVAFQTLPGTVAVTNILPGDVNGDGKVNAIDRITLSRFLAKWTDYGAGSIDPLAADVNGDGKVNSMDRIILSRHLAKWENYLTLPYQG